MYQWLIDPQQLLQMFTGILAIMLGASFRTLKLLKSKDINVKVSWLEWINNQATSLPMGLIALWVVPLRYPNIKHPELLALMLGIGFFSAEVFTYILNKIFSGKNNGN